jgi:ketosteroid isomerase-like protein
MKLITAAAAAVLMISAMAVGQESMSSKSEMHAGAANVEQHLKNLEDRWTKASQMSDGKALEPILADDFIGIDSDGSMRSKSEAIERTSKAKFQTSEISEVKVSQHGDSAVVTGIWTGKGTGADGKPIDTRERWADTWVMREGKWVCVASVAAPLKPGM